MTKIVADAFDLRIRELTENGKYDLEDIFNLGVQLGRHLEKEHLSDLRLSYFAEVEKNSDLRKKFAQHHKKLCDWLERLVKASIEAQINQNKFRGWSIGDNSDYGSNSKFDSRIVEKRYVQFASACREADGHFSAYFELQGKIRDLFEKHKQPTKFELIVDNDDREDYVLVSNEEQIGSLYGCVISYNCDFSEDSVRAYIMFVNDLEKTLLLTLLE